jgi:sugar lactone lactonase YvrE
MSRARRVVLAVMGVLALIAAYLFFWPVPVDPAAWTPPDAPALEGVFAPNDALATVEILDLGGEGPEDIQWFGGSLCGGLLDGRIMCRRSDGSLQELADTGGRPLGLAYNGRGRLIVADADKGLLSVSPDGDILRLSSEHNGLPYAFTDDVDIAQDGTIYFTDASHKWDRHNVREDVLEHRPYGRLLAYEPQSGRTSLLADDLYFANGVAVAADDSFVLVVETTKYRVLRFWLKGPRKGQRDVFIDNLPGMPDGISRGDSGRFWIALYTPRLSSLDSMLPKPWLRRLVYRLPRFLQPDAIRHSFVVAVNAEGTPVLSLQHNASDSFSPVTSVEEHNGELYLGSLTYSGTARIAAPPAP